MLSDQKWSNMTVQLVESENLWPSIELPHAAMKLRQGLWEFTVSLVEQVYKTENGIAISKDGC